MVCYSFCFNHNFQENIKLVSSSYSILPTDIIAGVSGLHCCLCYFMCIQSRTKYERVPGLDDWILMSMRCSNKLFCVTLRQKIIFNMNIIKETLVNTKFFFLLLQKTTGDWSFFLRFTLFKPNQRKASCFIIKLLLLS